MREQRQDLEIITSCQRSLWLKWRCINDLYCYVFYLCGKCCQYRLLKKSVLSEILYINDANLMGQLFEGLENEFRECL